MTDECNKIIVGIIFFIFNSAIYAQDILWKEIRIPMSEAGPNGLEAILVEPNIPGKHPLALISHGSPRDADMRADMTALSFLPIATEFARRGFVSAVVLRRGYGSSDGNWVEGYGTCKAANYKQAALISAQDLHAAINYLDKLPQVDADQMIAVGVSAGGFATIGLTADSPPKGLVAAIGFAPGRGSTARDTVCQEEALVSSFGFLGKTSRIPMLWVYAENDHFFNPSLAREFLKEFNENGGNATLNVAPAFKDDGHTLFSTTGIPEWTPLVDGFLKTQHIVLLNEKLPLPERASLQPPSQMASKSRDEFLKYLASPPHKAFAIDAKGAFGWRSGRHTIDEAKDKALAACKQFSATGCKLYAIENEYAGQ